MILSNRAKISVLCIGWLLLFLPLKSSAVHRDPTEAFQVMAAAGAAYLNDSSQCPGLLSAATLHADLDLYTVIDIRSEQDYLAGHIPGAFHSSLGTLIDDLPTFPSDKPCIVVDYTGQVASQAKMAMEMIGYGDVHSLLFGMSSWNSALDSWSSRVGNDLTNPEIIDQNGNLLEHEFPDLVGDPGSIVADRVAANLAQGYQGISYQDMMDYFDDVFVINYFSEEDYLGQGENGVPGHIPGAFQFTPYASMGMEQMLSNIPVDMPVVVYGWTGQHSVAVVTYLNLLGYQAYNLNYGANALFYDDLTSHKWDPNSQNDFELEYGYPPNETFNTIANALLDYVNDPADCPGLIQATSLMEYLENYNVIDIRSQTSFSEGHIPGAYNSSLATLLDDVGVSIPTDKPLVLVCYTGQLSGHAAIALEMAGFEDTYSLMWGMSSWNSSLDVWTSHIGDELVHPETTGNNGELTLHNFPVLEGDTVESRVSILLTMGFKGIDYSQVQEYPDEFFIINYFGEADYMGEGSFGSPGHIPGAYQFTPYASMGIEQMLGSIPTDMPVVVYGWTGQFSSQITAYLNMLGYDAYSLKWGANGLFHSELLGHNWGPGAMHDFPLENLSAVPDADQFILTHLGNHPNPFNPSTTITFGLKESAPTTLRIYDLNGRLIRTLVNGEVQSAGVHEIVWRGKNDHGQTVASGTYIYRLDAGSDTESRSLMLLK